MDTAGNLTCCKWVNTLHDYRAIALSKYNVLSSHYSLCFFLIGGMNKSNLLIFTSFTLSSHLLHLIFSFVVTGFCDAFDFCFTILTPKYTLAT